MTGTGCQPGCPVAHDLPPLTRTKSPRFPMEWSKLVIWGGIVWQRLLSDHQNLHPLLGPQLDSFSQYLLQSRGKGLTRPMGDEQKSMSLPGSPSIQLSLRFLFAGAPLLL